MHCIGCAGGRVKIGFQTVLKLLRAACTTVIVTSRFPVDTALRLRAAAEAESNSSHATVSGVITLRQALDEGRCVVYGLDLRDQLGLDAFIAEIKRRFSRIDILVNNATQVRKPYGQYLGYGLFPYNP